MGQREVLMALVRRRVKGDESYVSPAELEERIGVSAAGRACKALYRYGYVDYLLKNNHYTYYRVKRKYATEQYYSELVREQRQEANAEAVAETTGVIEANEIQN